MSGGLVLYQFAIKMGDPAVGSRTPGGSEEPIAVAKHPGRKHPPKDNDGIRLKADWY